jgi:hypothetical protein
MNKNIAAFRVFTQSDVSVNTPPLVDFSRASHLRPFEQPESGFFNAQLDRHCAKLRGASSIRRGRPMIRRLSQFVHGTFVLLLCAPRRFGAQAEAWRRLGKTLQAAKKQASWFSTAARIELCEN